MDINGCSGDHTDGCLRDATICRKRAERGSLRDLLGRRAQPAGGTWDRGAAEVVGSKPSCYKIAFIYIVLLIYTCIDIYS